MHKFSRGEPPVDFDKIKEKYDNDYVAFCENEQEQHRQIGDALYLQQGHYCAYCETIIGDKQHGHIEHMERRSDNPDRTFDWSNLFFSCCHHDSCGKYKDDTTPRISYNCADIVDPSTEDPLDFFNFDVQGNIFPRNTLSAEQKRRAEETIRIFNLDKSPRLKSIRRRAAESADAFLKSEPEPTDDEIDDFLSSLAGADCISVYYSLLNRRMA